MARIKCRTPSTGKAIRVASASVSNTFITIAEAPDFSVPDASNKFAERDPLDPSRAIRPGEVFFLTPLAAKNKDSVTRWIETQLVTEDSVTIELGRVEVPAGDTAFIPLQGRSLFKRTANNASGDSIEVRGEVTGIFDVWAAAEEKLSSEHAGVEE
jgi:hypothetical protein